MSRREIKIDVWKYIRPILMGLGAVLEKKLDNQDRALRPNKERQKKESPRIQWLVGHTPGRQCSKSFVHIARPLAALLTLSCRALNTALQAEVL